LDEGAERAADVARHLAHAPFEDIDALCEASAGDGRAQVRAAVAATRRRQAREGAERRRVESMYALQSRLGGDGLVLGIDEVGRGAVAGPLCVAAVALPRSPLVWGVNDSKKLSPKRREELATRIAELALAIGIAYVEPESIDALGMGQCLRMAMRMAIEDSHVDPDAVLIDGNPVHVHPAERCIVRGDSRVACIAAASIVAKVSRDALMVGLDASYPGYHLAESKGYASPEHIAAIRKKGLSELHRATFCEHFVDKSAR
jgi:ribonuclease HII